MHARRAEPLESEPGRGERARGKEGGSSAAGQDERTAGKIDRPVVVLVHGFLVSGRYMVPLMRELGREFDVWAPDLPGFGRSRRVRRTRSPENLADELAAWMEAAGLERAHLFGNSYGCNVVVCFALRHPERAGRLVLQGPTADAAARSFWRQFWRIARDVPRERPSIVPVVGWDWLKTLDPRLWLIRDTLRHAIHDPIEAKLPRVEAPALVVRGGRDPLAPQEWAEQVAGLLPRGRLHVIEGAPHGANYSNPAELASVVKDFLCEEKSVAG